MSHRFGTTLVRMAAGLLLTLAWAGLGTTAFASEAKHHVITVMTQNMFQGSELGEVITAQTLQQFLSAVTTDFQQVQASRVSERTAAMAREIANNTPDLVGLQEAALWQTGPIFQPPATNVAFDLIQTLVDQLAALGLTYVPVVVTNNTDVEAPSTLGIDVRFTDRVAILARTGSGHDLALSNPQHQNFVARLVLNTAAGPVVVTDGWASVDASDGFTQFRFVTTHLSGIAPPIQVLEGNELLAGPANTSLPVIVTGDFNSSATPGGVDATPTYANMVAGGLQDAWAVVSPGDPGLTCCQRVPDLLNPTSTLSERIDFVFEHGAIRPLEAHLVGASQQDRTPSGLWPSDHAGIAASLKLRPNEGET